MLFIRFEALTTQPAAALQKIYQDLEIPPFEHNFNDVPQATQEDDAIRGYSGLHTIQPKVAPVPPDCLEVIGQVGIRYVQQNNAWYQQLLVTILFHFKSHIVNQLWVTMFVA